MKTDKKGIEVYSTYVLVSKAAFLVSTDQGVPGCYLILYRFSYVAASMKHLMFLVLLGLFAAPALSIKCHECGQASGSGTDSWTSCSADYLTDEESNKAKEKTCSDGVDYCVWFSWADGKSMSGCGGDGLGSDVPMDTCKEDFTIPDTDIKGELCTCKEDMCNGADPVATSALAFALVLGAAIYGARY